MAPRERQAYSIGVKQPTVHQLGLKKGYNDLIGLGRKLSTQAHSVIDSPLAQAVGDLLPPAVTQGVRAGVNLFDKALGIAGSNEIQGLAQGLDDAITSTRRKINPQRR